MSGFSSSPGFPLWVKTRSRQAWSRATGSVLATHILEFRVCRMAVAIAVYQGFIYLAESHIEWKIRNIYLPRYLLRICFFLIFHHNRVQFYEFTVVGFQYWAIYILITQEKGGFFLYSTHLADSYSLMPYFLMPSPIISSGMNILRVSTRVFSIRSRM